MAAFSTKAFSATAAFCLGLALTAGAALAHGPGSGTGMMMGPGMMGPGMMGPGMMGPGMMGPGMMGNGMGMYPGMMGPGMMHQGMMGHGMGHGMGYGMGPGMMMGPGGPYGATREPLSTEDVTAMMQRWLEWRGNPRLKLGEVKAESDDAIVADIVTAKEGALVERLRIDRRTGWLQRQN